MVPTIPKISFLIKYLVNNILICKRRSKIFQACQLFLWDTNDNKE